MFYAWMFNNNRYYIAFDFVLPQLEQCLFVLLSINSRTSLYPNLILLNSYNYNK